MKWPWVSRRAYDLLVGQNAAFGEQVAALQAQVAKMVDDLVRVRRFESGLTETPRKEKPPLESMPHELYLYIQGWHSEATRKQQRSRAYQRHMQGESWDSIKADMMMAPDTNVDTGLTGDDDVEQG